MPSSAVILRALKRLARAVLGPPPRVWYAVKHARSGAWLVDTCAGGTYLCEFGASVWFEEPDEARLALLAAELHPRDHVLVRLTINPTSNHYHMSPEAW